MTRVFVRTLPGRIARVAPQGRYIPSSEFIGVRLTPYIARLANYHGDIEIAKEPAKSSKTPAATSSASTKTAE